MSSLDGSLAFSLFAASAAFVTALFGVARAWSIVRDSRNRNSLVVKIRRESGEVIEFTGEGLDADEVENILRSILMQSDAASKSATEQDQRPDAREDSEPVVVQDSHAEADHAQQSSTEQHPQPNS